MAGARTAEKSEWVTAPLPTAGFRFDYALSPKGRARSKYEPFFLPHGVIR